MAPQTRNRTNNKKEHKKKYNTITDPNQLMVLKLLVYEAVDARKKSKNNRLPHKYLDK